MSTQPPDTQVSAHDCVVQMVLAGEGGLALEYCRDFGLPDAVLQLDPRALAEEAAVRAATYLALAVPLERLLFVNDR